VPGPYRVVGPYLLIQQRLRRHGLPASLQTGTAQPAGRCLTWSGTYPDGQRWLAFQHGAVSVFLLSNLMTQPQLTSYVARDLCP
jgi:hypothetical protein